MRKPLVLAESSRTLESLKIDVEDFSDWVQRILNKEEDGFFQADHLFGDNVDEEMVNRRMKLLFKTPLRDIYASIGSNFYFSPCLVCHEIFLPKGGEMCDSPAFCVRSFGNALCVHTDNAMVWNYVYVMLFTLLQGGLIETKEFEKYVGWILALSGLLREFDLLAFDRVEFFKIPVTKQEWNDVFSVERDPDVTQRMQNDILVFDHEQKLYRNRLIQEKFAQKIQPFLEEILLLIRYKMEQVWNYRKIDNQCTMTSRIVKIRREYMEKFFTKFRPKILLLKEYNKTTEPLS